MKFNRLMWIVVVLLVSSTVAVTLGTRGANERGISSTPEPQSTPPEISKYGIADYNTDEPLDPTEREQRRSKNQRYDKEDWVEKNPHPETGMVGRHTEGEPPPAMPTEESSLIVVGRVVGLRTFLSNDKTGVYTEYNIKVDQILKNNHSLELSQGKSITIDRAGGVVRYPHGQNVIYLDSDNELPENGGEYLLFLRSKGESENFAVIRLYELQATKTVALDRGRAVDDIERMGKSDFVKAVKDKVSRPAHNKEGKP